ncbi:AMP-dependent synthetase/ligase [Spirillospora sp. NPDC047279]|uniref:AMP-dependent synthetase/ligase n=1 Tax=Spirillospora sp. NPDC047279 TaxID=3155478 RepID=UPI0033CC0F5E
MESGAVGTGSRTMADLVPLAAAAYGTGPALLFKDEGRWKPVSYGRLWEAVAEVGGGLTELGLRPGAKAAILANSRPEWTYAHFGVLTAGAVSVSVHQAASAEECRHILEHSETELIFVEDGVQLGKILSVRDRLPRLRHIVVFDPPAGAGGVLSLDEVRRVGRAAGPAELTARIAAVGPGRPCVIIYTPGTTGTPKGCVLSHGNYRAAVTMIAASGTVVPGDRVYLFLPLAQAFAAVVQFASIDLGCSIALWEKDPQKIISNLGEVRPTYLPAVPRILEKIYVRATAQAGDPARVREDVEIGLRARALLDAGTEIPEDLRRSFDRAEETLYRKVRALFGGRIRQCTSGASPVAPEMLDFFHACGVPVLEAYGLTETATVATANAAGGFRLGSVGRPLPGVEATTSESGELLLRGPNVFGGYYKDEPSSRRALQDGWFHTGDLASIDDGGYVHLTGRRKDVIITSGGRNIAPARAEKALRESRWISQAVLVGDRRPYLVALITLDPDEAAGYAAANGLSPETVTTSSGIREVVRREVDRVNAGAGRAEQIKRFAILPGGLSVETGELTPNLEVARPVVHTMRRDVIDSLYGIAPPGR